MADNKPNYTSTVPPAPVVKFINGADTDYSPVMGVSMRLVAGVQLPHFLVNVPGSGFVWKEATLCVWETFVAPAGPPA